jgi:hypothetical protein
MNFRALFLLLMVLAPLAALAQSANGNAGNTGASGTPPAAETKPATLPGTDEIDRLMQEYMARRAEWMAVRKVATDLAAKAPNETARKAILKQLETDELPSQEKMNDAAKAYHDAKKKKNPGTKPRG